MEVAFLEQIPFGFQFGAINIFQYLDCMQFQAFYGIELTVNNITKLFNVCSMNNRTQSRNFF